MEIINIIEIIAESGNRGKELMIDSFILGIAWGRKLINTIQGIQQASQYLYQLNQEVEHTQISPFYKLDQFHKFMIEDNYHLFPQIDANFKQQLKEEIKQIRQVPEIKEKKLVLINQIAQSLCGICQFYINDLEEEKCKITQCGHEFHNLCLYEKIDQQGLQQCYTCSIQLDPIIKTQIFKNISTSFKSCCPNPECREEFIYFGQLTYNCQKCNMKCCLKCKLFEHDDDQCTIEIDNIGMKQGQKFKFCFKCFQIIELNFQDFNSHQCNLQENNLNCKSLKYFTVFKKKLMQKIKN